MLNEIWKPVVGYKRLYEVSNLGKVRSLDRWKPHSRTRELHLFRGRILRLSPQYKNKHLESLNVTLYKNGQHKRVRVHRLVLKAFVGPCPKGLQGCHNNGKPENNKLTNLRGGTGKSNTSDAFKHESRAGKAVLRSDGQLFVSQSEAARQTGCDSGDISRVVNGKQLTAGGYKWK